MAYCAYLRKSRADAEAELRGEGETLTRHQTILLDLAKRMNLFIGTIYKEIVSGESIADRPVMQHVLSEVEQGFWDGVFVVEIERLARGDSVDQGVIMRAFRISGTSILTPVKIYDPNNEFDEEYLEFNLFMSRREYKTINRRIQAGRIQSIKEGKYISPIPPYGYDRVKIKDDKGYTLTPNLGEAPVAQMIYNWYCHDMIGSHTIAIRLNALGYRSRSGSYWTAVTIRDMVKNPVYAGWIKWGERVEVKTIRNGTIHKRRLYNPNHLLIPGLHPALISQDDFDRAQEVRKNNYIPSTKAAFESSGLKNPLAGLLICGKCGKVMQRQDCIKNGKHQIRLLCANSQCDNISSIFDFVEDELIEAIGNWLQDYRLQVDTSARPRMNNDLEGDLIRLRKERDGINGQVSKLHDLLERGVYDIDTFLHRNSVLGDRLKKIDKSIETLAKKEKADKKGLSPEKFLPLAESVITAYRLTETNEEKNKMLKSILKDVIYTKTKKGKGHEHSFSLEIHPLLDV